MSDTEISDPETLLHECYLFVDDHLQLNPKVVRWHL